jgi:Prenyltransferase and squalene oxidase repeat
MSTGTETQAIERGLRFLARRQLPDGGFSLRYGFDVASPETVADDHALFGTALIAGSLSACRLEAAEPILDRAVARLVAVMEPGGVWRHWAPEERRHHVVAPDVDDTACISVLLRDRGIPFPDNRDLLLANRDPGGRFYTWMVARWPPPRSARLAWIAVKRWRHPRLARELWTTTPADPPDVDGVVNANVLHYLGDGPHAAPVVEWLVGLFRRREDHACDKWYRGSCTFAWAVARAARAGVAGLDAIREEMCARLVASQAPDGRIGDGPLDTALAVCALSHWGARPDEAAAACAYLESVQAPDGSWPAEAMYFAGPRLDPPLPRWGSGELTTGFCVEALSRCPGT